LETGNKKFLMIVLKFNSRITKLPILLFLCIVPIYTLSNGLSNNDSTMKQITPKSAAIRSAIIPGWGQFYVKKPLKAAVFITAEGYHLYQAIYYSKIYGYVKETKEEIGIEAWTELNEAEKKGKVKEITGYELKINSWRPREKRNKYLWWSLGIHLVGILDAYVDAHLVNFPDENFELSTILSEDYLGISLSFSIGR
jgi:hypothetical protein